MNRIATALGIGLGFGLAGGVGASPVAAEPEPADPVLAEMGAPLFARYCASCHGAQARGDGPVAKALNPPPADLTRIATRRGGDFPEGEIARFIDGRFNLDAHGSREMPVWGERLAPAVPDAGISEAIVRGNIVSLVEYLKSLQEEK
ncbi:MAG: c-type cytochrome [Myxococcota bacterium]